MLIAGTCLQNLERVEGSRLVMFGLKASGFVAEIWMKRSEYDFSLKTAAELVLSAAEWQKTKMDCTMMEVICKGRSRLMPYVTTTA